MAKEKEKYYMQMGGTYNSVIACNYNRERDDFFEPFAKHHLIRLGGSPNKSISHSTILGEQIECIPH